MIWPPHGLLLTTPSLVLRGMTEPDALALAEVQPDDLPQDPNLPTLSRAANVLQAYGAHIGGWRVDDWVLPFTVVHDGVPVGLQALEGKDFLVRRTVDSHSWLVEQARGRGLGKQMRAAVLTLAFEHLGATHAVTEAWDDNAASLGVSRALGYRDNGLDTRVRDGGLGFMQRLVVGRSEWSSPVPVTVEGLPPCLPWFGL